MSLARRLTFAYTKQNKPLRAPERASRASFPPPLKGSMTLEAAAAIPLFLFFVMNLLFIFEAVRLQTRDPESLKSLHRRLFSDVPQLPPLENEVDAPLNKVIQFRNDLASYDRALKGGAANG